MKEANEESRTTIAAVREEAIINVLEPIKANIDKNKRTRPLRRQKRSAAPKSKANVNVFTALTKFNCAVCIKIVN